MTSASPPANPSQRPGDDERPVVGDLDLTSEHPSETTRKLDLTKEPPSRKEPTVTLGRVLWHREKMRSVLAGGLLVLLALVMLGGFMTAWRFGDTKVAETLLEKMLSPLVALVSAATGFYFGSETRS